MKKSIILLSLSLLCIVFIPSVFGGDVKLNPITSEYYRALNDANSNNDSNLGGLPFPVKLGYDAFQPNRSLDFDSYFDLRDLGMLPPVKSQTSGGCWAFSSMSTMESRMLMLGEGLYNLSENNLKYCHGFFDSRSTNGNAWMTTAYFARQSGPLYDFQDPNSGGTSQPGVDCPVNPPPAFFVRDSRYPPGDMNTIKQLVMDIGSIWSLLYYSDTYFNSGNNTYYYGGTHAVNHVFNIVGWDDNKVTAGGVGAWICQNTYGAGWGEGGFVYVSYNDSQFLVYNAYFPNYEVYNDDSRVLLHDELGNYSSLGYDLETGYALTKYTLSENLFIEKIGTYAMAYGTSIEIELFSDFDEGTGTVSGLLGSVSPQVTGHPGLYTFNLDNQFSLQAGDDLYVKVKYTTPSYNWPIPIELYIDTYADPYIESDVSWVSETGLNGNWDKIGNNTALPYDLCINVYGQYNPVTIPLPNWLIILVFVGLIAYYRFRVL